MSDPRFEALRGSRLAAELDDAQCKKLAELTELMELKDGDVLVREGTSDDHLFIIISGALGVVRHPQGEAPVTLHTLVAGDFAGESDAEIVYRAMRAIIRTAHVIQRRLSVQSVELANYIYKQHGRY
jgi:CRP/FNR family cyclic AMP-dependent transcriptional regulator